MPSIHLRGDLAPKEQSRTYKWSPNSGGSVNQTFRNFDEDLMNQLAGQYEAAGVAYEVTVAHDVCTLTTQDSNGSGSGSGDSAVVDSWQIVANNTSPAIDFNPVVYSGIYSEVGSDTAVRDRLNLLRDSARGNIVKVGATPYTTAEFRAYLIAQSDPYCARILDYLIGDVNSYASADYVLRHTTNVSNRWNSNVSDDYVLRVYSTAELLSEVQNAGLWIYPLPGRLAYKINALSTSLIADYGSRDYQAWGWLKQPSTESTAANNRVDINTEYWFQRWSTDFYLER
jgi:hypothetical protein